MKKVTYRLPDEVALNMKTEAKEKQISENSLAVIKLSRRK